MQPPRLNRIRTELSETGVNDAGLEHIGKMENLERLELWLTKITDAGLPQLANCKKLKLLDIRQTNCSDAGLNRADAAASELDRAVKDRIRQHDPGVGQAGHGGSRRLWRRWLPK